MEAPAGVVGAEGFQATVADAEQTDVFEVGLDDPPAAPQVFVETVFSQFGEGAENVRGSRGLRIQLRVPGYLAGGEAAGADHGIGDAFKGEFVVAQEGGVKDGAEKGDVNEIVEMAGLKGSVLAIIGEGEQLVAGTRLLRVGSS